MSDIVMFGLQISSIDLLNNFTFMRKLAMLKKDFNSISHCL